MNKKKSLYEAPTTDVLVIRFEEGILIVSGGDPGAAGNNLGKGNTWGFDDDDD